jgi:hypothetical protein
MRPESLVIDTHGSRLILGLAVVNFNHIVSPDILASSDCSNRRPKQVGPTVEMAYPESILDDEELCKILPFLALPDGAHLVINTVLL